MADEKNAQVQMSLFGDDALSEPEPEPAQSPRARHAELNRILNHAAYAYYALDNPEMTDAAFDRLLQVQAGLTLQRSLYDEAIAWNEDVPEQLYRRMMRTPDTYGYFTATLTPLSRLSVSLTGNYTGSMLVGHNAGSGTETPVAVDTRSFFTLGTKVSYDFPVGSHLTLQVNAGVQNLTDAFQKDLDTGWNRDSAYIYGPSTPRSFFVGAKFVY